MNLSFLTSTTFSKTSSAGMYVRMEDDIVILSAQVKGNEVGFE